MNHVKSAFAILFAVIALSIGSEYLVSSRCNDLRGLLTELTYAAITDDKASAGQLCEAVNEKWKESEPLFSCIVPLEKVCQAEQSICRLKPLFESDSDELAAEAACALALCSRIN
ncbi:MAG: DUF4363 family protein [Ruminococcus sp.]